MSFAVRHRFPTSGCAELRTPTASWCHDRARLTDSSDKKDARVPPALRKGERGRVSRRDPDGAGMRRFSRGPISGWIAGVAAGLRRRRRLSAVDAGARGRGPLLIGAGGAPPTECRGGSLRTSRPPPQTRKRSRVESVPRSAIRASAGAALIDARALGRSAPTRARAQRGDCTRRRRASAGGRRPSRQDEFLAILGHEPQPLAPALTALHLMKQRGIAEALRERGIVERQIQHGAARSTCSTSRAQRGAIDLRRERFELAEAVARAVEITSSLFQEKRHQLDVRFPPASSSTAIA